MGTNRHECRGRIGEDWRNSWWKNGGNHGGCATIPGCPDCAKYALPMVGTFGAKGARRIVMSPGLDALEMLDGAGARPYGSTYEREW